MTSEGTLYHASKPAQESCFWRRRPLLFFAAGVLGIGLLGAQPKSSERRSIDGTGNNLAEPTFGSAGIQLLRLTPAFYEQGNSSPAGSGRSSAREISNGVNAQTGSLPNPVGATDFVWQWGQFLDHDVDLTTGADPPEPFDIPVPLCDPFFDPDCNEFQVIPLNRSIYDPATGSGVPHPRQQLNEITAFIDASNVYGSDPVRAAALRTNDGTGQLKTSEGDFLPFNTEGLPNAGGSGPELFLAGDIRANEQVGLTAMHTLFVREHNRLARLIQKKTRNLSGEEIYNTARAIVGAQMHVITYRDFIPIILGPNGLCPYTGYYPEVNPGISNSFSTAAYRLGHSMLSSVLLRLNNKGRPIPEGNLPLRNAFFNPKRITDEGGIEPLLRGLAAQVMQNVDPFVVDEVRNFLFGLPGAGGFDLASVNIQRGRDHGLPDYNEARIAFDLPPVGSFADITSDVELQQKLESAYGHVNNIDIWVGGLAEDHLPGALVGELFFAILKDQFERLRDGDRFWYQNVFSGRQLRELEKTTLAGIIRRNTKIGKEIQDNVFLVED